MEESIMSTCDDVEG